MFRVEFSTRAKKEFESVADERLEKAINTLVIDPVPARLYDVKKLQGVKDTFRIRIG